MKYFQRANALRIAGFIGAAVAAAYNAYHGDWVTAGGIMSSALSAAGLKGSASVNDG